MPSVSSVSPLRSRQTPAGPGLLESVGWTVGYLIAQCLAFAAVCLGFLIVVFGTWPDQSAMTELILATDLDRTFLPFGVTTLACLFLLVPLVRFRLGPTARTWLKIQPPRRDQFILVTSAIVPLAIVSNGLYQWSRDMWASLSSTAQTAASLPVTDTVSTMLQFARVEPLPILIVAMALGPAIGEELIFRGLIGNGLTARWGRGTGMLITSILFAVAHLSPAHALATIPIGLFLHHVYLSTGSYWMAVTGHFLNNLLAVTVARYELAVVPEISAAIFSCSTGMVLITVLLLEQTSCSPEKDAESPPMTWNAILPGHTRLIAIAMLVTYTSTLTWTALTSSLS